MQKKSYGSAISDVSCSIAECCRSRDNFLHVISNLFGKTEGPEFIKSPFLLTVKIKLVSSIVATSGNIGFDFTEKYTFNLLQ